MRGHHDWPDNEKGFLTFAPTGYTLHFRRLAAAKLRKPFSFTTLDTQILLTFPSTCKNAMLPQIDEEHKQLKLWIRRKRGNRSMTGAGCGRRVHKMHEVYEREIRDLPCFEYQTIGWIARRAA